MSRRVLWQPKVRLDSSPTGTEEWDAWLSENALQPTWDPDQARVRIDKIARWLARGWSFFLVYLIFAQGIGTGVHLELPFTGRSLPIGPTFHLQSTEFVAVVTTTTISVFGFLVIVSRALFKSAVEKERAGDA